MPTQDVKSSTISVSSLLTIFLVCTATFVVDCWTPNSFEPVNRSVRTSFLSVSVQSRRVDPPPDFTIEDDDDYDSVHSQSTFDAVIPPREGEASIRPDTNDSAGRAQARKSSDQSSNGASWMQRNSQFKGEEDELTSNMSPPRVSKRRRVEDGRSDDSVVDNKSFRQDFRGTRVFVQGLPPDCSWQTLKDHFKIAGNVVFASVSADPITGRSKGHGIVQYETTNEALNAISMMRSFPLDNCELYVREDVQDTGTDQPWSKQGVKGPTPPSKWKCANAEDVQDRLGDDTIKAIQQILKARDQARRRRNYDASDAMREELRQKHNVQLDDRLTLWWVGTAPPTMVQEIKGEGRWGDRTTEWRQIPTTPEFDACVDPDLVQGLLKQRDIARLEKDFATADALLEQARQAPDGDLYLRIHDESRTWRIWTDEPPKRPVRHESDAQEQSVSPAEQCLAICKQYAPEKTDEVKTLLAKFPGREYNILKKLKQRYIS
jgi:RNA recognition motif. (a.k.a. RRM, RBD, or RNP domain)